MPKLLSRVIACLMVFPCLIADPAFASALRDPFSQLERAEMNGTITPPFTQEALAPCAAPFLRGLTERFLSKEVLIQFALVAIGLAVTHAGHPWGPGVVSLAMVPPAGNPPHRKEPLTAKEALVQLQGNEEAVCEWLNDADPLELIKIFKKYSYFIEKARSLVHFRTMTELRDQIRKDYPRTGRDLWTMRLIRENFSIILPPKSETQVVQNQFPKMTVNELRVLLSMRKQPTDAPAYSIARIQNLLGTNTNEVENIFRNLLARKLIQRLGHVRTAYFEVTTEGYKILDQVHRALKQRRATKAKEGKPGEKGFARVNTASAIAGISSLFGLMLPVLIPNKPYSFLIIDSKLIIEALSIVTAAAGLGWAIHRSTRYLSSKQIPTYRAA